jgi:hypothetical protein
VRFPDEIAAFLLTGIAEAPPVAPGIPEEHGGRQTAVLIGEDDQVARIPPQKVIISPAGDILYNGAIDRSVRAPLADASRQRGALLPARVTPLAIN